MNDNRQSTEAKKERDEDPPRCRATERKLGRLRARRRAALIAAAAVLVAIAFLTGRPEPRADDAPEGDPSTPTAITADVRSAGRESPDAAETPATRPLVLVLFIVGVSLGTSFCCSLLEACLYSITVSRIETLRRSGDRRGETLARLRARIDEAIAAILIANTTANVLGAAWAGGIVRVIYGDNALALFSAGFTLAVLFFAEIVPKSLGVRFAHVFAPMLAPVLRVMVFCLWPLVRLCVLLTRKWGNEESASQSSEEDIISMAHLVHRDGEIHAEEAQWVANALRLNDVTAYHLMTPNPVVARVPRNMNIRETRLDADHWRFSRLPVCADESPDEIVGVVRRRRVFNALARDQFDLVVGDLMEPPEFVPADLSAHRLLDSFLQKRKHLFCVNDERGQFVGVVTLEDVLECLLGREIVDETDLHEDMQAVAQRRKKALLSRLEAGPEEEPTDKTSEP